LIIPAGFKPTTRNALDVSACQLLRRPKVKARIWELQTQIARRSAVTLDTLLDELEAARERAHELGQPSAAIAATMGRRGCWASWLTARSTVHLVSLPRH
jgi:hypothetical protein